MHSRNQLANCRSNFRDLLDMFQDFNKNHHNSKKHKNSRQSPAPETVSFREPSWLTLLPLTGWDLRVSERSSPAKAHKGTKNSFAGGTVKLSGLAWLEPIEDRDDFPLVWSSSPFTKAPPSIGCYVENYGEMFPLPDQCNNKFPSVTEHSTPPLIPVISQIHLGRRKQTHLGPREEHF